MISSCEYHGIYGYDRRQDFVFTISVEGHGEYPTEKVLEDPEIVVSGVEDEGERNAWEYYVNLCP